MKYKAGETYLINTDRWFFAPDGEQYKAVWGTIHEINTDAQILGIKTNRNATNWYLNIGNMVIAGCQIHYGIKCKTCCFGSYHREVEHKGKVNSVAVPTRIYNANEAY